MNWPFAKRNPARELAELAAAKRRREALTQQELKLAVARQLRAEKGLPPHPAFGQVRQAENVS